MFGKSEEEIAVPHTNAKNDGSIAVAREKLAVVERIPSCVWVKEEGESVRRARLAEGTPSEIDGGLCGANAVQQAAARD